MTFQLDGTPEPGRFSDKQCSRCKKVKSPSEFRHCRGRNGKPGLASRCIQCNIEYMKEYYFNHKEKFCIRTEAERDARNSARRERYRNDEEYREEIKKKTQEYHRARPQRKREVNLIANYGITAEAYDEILDLQGGGCAICGRKENVGKRHKHLHVDHDHNTGEVRGILCDSCNHGIGKLLDNPSLLRRAADYLEGTIYDYPFGVIHEDDGNDTLL